MDKDPTVPFIVGQKAEAKSFQRGFRSAWFRCEVKQICQMKGRLQAFVDYYDFIDEPSWLVLYQRPSYGNKSKDRQKNLMLRPEFPVICHESQIRDVNTLQEALVTPDVNTVQEVVLVFNGHWKVGDMVDWLNSGCYWSGRITEILGTEKAKIELILPPVGEGVCYEVSVKDLRPTLEWSIESGWTVPISKGHEESCCCARLIHPSRQEYAGVTNNLDKRISHTGVSSTERQPDDGCLDVSIEEASAEKKTPHIGELTETPPGKGCPDGNIGEASVDNIIFEDSHQFNGCYQDMMSSEGFDSLEASVLGLEELLNKVKWLKRTLEVGTSSSKSGRPSWEFVEHRG